MVSVSLETEHMLDQLDLHLAPSSDSTVCRNLTLTRLQIGEWPRAINPIQ